MLAPTAIFLPPHAAAKTPSCSIAPQRRAVTEAFAQLLIALQLPHRLGNVQQTAQRTAALWLDRLLVGEHFDWQDGLPAPMPHAGQTPVCVRHLAMHLVCPHHLTVAFGSAAIAYLPAGQLASFGTLSTLLQACTARLILQEEATQNLAAAVVTHLRASAAVVLLEATHPCHRLTRPQAHAAVVTTVSYHGAPAACASLAPLLWQAASR